MHQRVDQAATALVHRTQLATSHQAINGEQGDQRYRLLAWQPHSADTLAVHGEHCLADVRGDLLVLPISGTVAIARGADQVRLLPRTGTLVNAAEPLTVRLGQHSRGVALAIPRHELASRLGRTPPWQASFSMASGLGSVVTSLLVAAYRQREALPPTQFKAICDRAIDLICMTLPNPGGRSLPAAEEIASKARRYVRDHAADPDLSSASLASGLGWSLRQVQASLQQQGTTPSALIRAERLRLASECLRDPALRRWTVSDIARSTGFTSLNTFSKVFRKNFGMSPREFRAKVTHTRSADRPDTLACPR